MQIKLCKSHNLNCIIYRSTKAGRSMKPIYFANEYCLSDRPAKAGRKKKGTALGKEKGKSRNPCLLYCLTQFLLELGAVAYFNLAPSTVNVPFADLITRRPFSITLTGLTAVASAAFTFLMPDASAGVTVME